MNEDSPPLPLEDNYQETREFQEQIEASMPVHGLDVLGMASTIATEVGHLDWQQLDDTVNLGQGVEQLQEEGNEIEKV